MNVNINEAKFIRKLRQNEKEKNIYGFIWEITGWSIENVIQIESVLFRHLSMGKDTFIANMAIAIGDPSSISDKTKEMVRIPC